MFSIDEYNNAVIHQIAKHLDYSTILSLKEATPRICSTLSDPLLWIELCERDNIVVPSLEFRNILSQQAKKGTYYQKRRSNTNKYACQWNFEQLWVNNPFGSNLVPPILEELAAIKNQYGTEWDWNNQRLISMVYESQTKHRCKIKRSDLVHSRHPFLHMAKWKYEWEDSGIVAEEPPFECEPHPDIKRCISSDYGWGDREITIDLVEAGVPAIVIDHIRPRIVVSELATTRQDCRSRYFLYAYLLSEHEKSSYCLSGTQARFRKEARYWARGTNPAQWERVEIIIENYPMGMRKLYVKSKGSIHEDPRKAGRCGSKYANLEIRIEMPKEVRWLNESDFPDKIGEDSSSSSQSS